MHWIVVAQRVFPLATVAATGDMAHRATADATAALEAEVAGLREVGALLRAEVADLKEDRDRWRTQAEASQRLLTDARPWWRRLAGYASRAVKDVCGTDIFFHVRGVLPALPSLS